MQDYKDEVTQAVAQLLEISFESKWNTLSVDTDEDVPYVRLWAPSLGRIAAYGYPSSVCIAGDLFPLEDETWSFLECCQKVLEAYAARKQVQQDALQALADQAQELNMGYGPSERKPVDDVALAPGWLKRQMDATIASVAKWPPIFRSLGSINDSLKQKPKDKES